MAAATGSAAARVTGSSVESGQTRVEIRAANGRQAALTLPRDATVASGTPPTRVTVLAEIPDVAIVLTDEYPSIAGGLSYCQAGEERFLRIVPLAGGVAGNVATIKVASCRENLELTDRGIEWEPPRTIRIHWLSGPGAKPEVRTIRITDDGRIQDPVDAVTNSPRRVR